MHVHEGSEIGRYVLLTRSEADVELVKCASAEEVRAHLSGGRPFSALVVGPGRLDHDLVHAALRRGCAVVPLGSEPQSPRESPPGSLVAVTGPGGTGASTIAMALADGLAGGARGLAGGPDGLAGGADVLLADLRLHAEMTMHHGLADLVPCVQDVVDALRLRPLIADELRAMTIWLPERGYRLLRGLPRAAVWPALRPRAFGAALRAICMSYDYVVADVDPDLEGEDESGSIDVEERNVMARTACARARAVVVVGMGGVKGRHAAARVVRGLVDFGVPADRIVPVTNRATGASDGLAVPECCSPVPVELIAPLMRALDAIAEAPAPQDAPVLVTPGCVGAWTTP